MRRRIKRTLQIAILALPLSIGAQVRNLTQSGVVQDKQSKNPIEGVRVSVIGNVAKSDTTTDSEGTFILTFTQGLDEGSPVRIRIEKPGYRPYEEWITVSSKVPLHVSLLADRSAPPIRTSAAPIAAIDRAKNRGQTVLGPEPGPRARIADPDTTGYLRSRPISMRFDKAEPTSLWVKFSTTNIGKLQVRPGALTLAYVRIRPEMNSQEEDALFSTVSGGGGKVRFISTEHNYWEPGETKLAPGEVKGETEWHTNPEDGPDAVIEKLHQSATQMLDGEANIYFYVRNMFADKLGSLATESCSYYKGPDFSLHECHGHNGPTDGAFAGSQSASPQQVPTQAPGIAPTGSASVGSIVQGPGSIAQVGGTGNTATVNNLGPVARHLSEQQITALGNMTIPDSVRLTIRTVSDSDSQRYAHEIFNALTGKVKLSDFGVVEGWSAPGPPPPSVSLFVHAKDEPDDVIGVMGKIAQILKTRQFFSKDWISPGEVRIVIGQY